MATPSSSGKLIIFALLVLLFAEDLSTARKISPRELKESHGFHINGDHQNQTDLSLSIFFTIDKLKRGQTLPFFFSRKDPSTSPRLLPREEADSIPFSSEKLPHLLQLFSLSEQSPQAKAVEYTLAQCELQSMEGETKFCATSLESMLDFAKKSFGSDTRFRVLTTNSDHRAEPETFRNYRITEEPREIKTERMIGCHKMPYPYVVYYCHAHGRNRLFELELSGENGERVEAAAACHMDTSEWDPENPSFRVLKIRPGTSPVCHFFPPDDLLWVPLQA